MNTLFNAVSRQASLDNEQVWGRVLEIARSHVNGNTAGGSRGAAHGTLLWDLGGLENVYVRCELLDDSRPGSQLVVVAIERSADLFPTPQELQARFRLTRREAEVALLVAERRSTQEMAEMLFVTRHTVRRHIEKVLLKLGVRRRTDVRHVLMAVKRGDYANATPWRRAVGV
ncbi:MAG TPA: helix-turn-helix transcriptional regulator [Longimicrobiales bacterium]